MFSLFIAIRRSDLQIGFQSDLSAKRSESTRIQNGTKQAQVGTCIRHLGEHTNEKGRVVCRAFGITRQTHYGWGEGQRSAHGDLDTGRSIETGGASDIYGEKIGRLRIFIKLTFHS